MLGQPHRGDMSLERKGRRSTMTMKTMKTMPPIDEAGRILNELRAIYREGGAHHSPPPMLERIAIILISY